jgi:Ca2+-binding EF-hand superfamily protein
MQGLKKKASMMVDQAAPPNPKRELYKYVDDHGFRRQEIDEMMDQFSKKDTMTLGFISKISFFELLPAYIRIPLDSQLRKKVDDFIEQNNMLKIDFASFLQLIVRARDIEAEMDDVETNLDISTPPPHPLTHHSAM